MAKSVEDFNSPDETNGNSSSVLFDVIESTTISAKAYWKPQVGCASDDVPGEEYNAQSRKQNEC
eukprot:7429471-Karenia_brevis.AAC.1